MNNLTRRWRTPAWFLSRFLGALLLAALAATPVLAHADLVASSPADGALLASPPTIVSLRFSEGLLAAKSSFRLAGPDGTVGAGRAVKDGDKVMALDGLALVPGAYTIKWTAASTDGHVERGTLAFSVDEPPAAPATPSAAPSEAPASVPDVAPSDAPTAAPASTAAAASEAPASGSPEATAAPDADTTSSPGGDVLVPIVVGLLVVGGVGAFVLRRSRGA
ncbi:MAG: copper resistance protein CopC [Chloroflexi bacterium]|nr:copper resistance protein CopC [Chloroflexota bacterium]